MDIEKTTAQKGNVPYVTQIGIASTRTPAKLISDPYHLPTVGYKLQNDTRQFEPFE